MRFSPTLAASSRLAVWLAAHAQTQNSLRLLCRRWGTTEERLLRFTSGEEQLHSSTLLLISADTGITVETLLAEADAAGLTQTKPLELDVKEQVIWYTTSPEMKEVYHHRDFADGVSLRAREAVTLMGGTDKMISTGLWFRDDVVLEFTQDDDSLPGSQCVAILRRISADRPLQVDVYMRELSRARSIKANTRLGHLRVASYQSKVSFRRWSSTVND